MFIHTVYFWLKDNTPEAAREKLIKDCYKYLKEVPTVKHLWAGKPAKTPRDVVDNSYSVGLTVILENREGHDVYQVHALHLDFIAQNKEHWKKVQVLDHVETNTAGY
jgi:hypothetical protein